MKLQKRLKGATDLKRKPPRLRPSDAVAQSLETLPADVRALFGRQLGEQARRRAAATPEECKAAGGQFTGTMPDKGKKDGSCNRSACQMPLAGKPQFWMRNQVVENGRLYYCRDCERAFSKWDRQINEPLRCTPDEGNTALGYRG